MKTALVLGGGASVWEDLEAAQDLFQPDWIAAVNDIGTRWPGGLNFYVTLHADKMCDWRKARADRGFKPALCHVGNEGAPGIDKVMDYRWPGMTGSGSSGLFAAKVALDHGADRVVLAGVPMQAAQSHFYGGGTWSDCSSFIDGWRAALPFIKDSVRSMSGWTKEILGAPTPEWLAEGQV
jgi:hypothetical protein